MRLNANEHIEYISNSLQLIVSSCHTFGTDALLLAAFSAPKKTDKVCDFGTGCGIIPFCWLREGTESAAAVEKQSDACEMLSRSIALNSLEKSFNLINGDIRELKGVLDNNTFDLITMNPPYTPKGSGIVSAAQSDRIARHETELSLPEMLTAARKLLKFGGRLCICLKPERLTEAMCAFSAGGIEPKRLRFVSQREGKAPWLFLLEGKKGRKPGLTVEAEFIMQAPDGTESEELQKIIGSYRKTP